MLTEDDIKLWETYTKVIVPINIKYENISRKNKRIKVNNISISTKLDLHNYTVQDAYRLFNEFIQHHYDFLNKRLVVITGKSGIIRQEFESWCKQNRHIRSVILQGDGGSYMVKLK